MWSQSSQTNRQRDRRTTCRGNTALCVASRGKNWYCSHTYNASYSIWVNTNLVHLNTARVLQFQQQLNQDAECRLHSVYWFYSDNILPLYPAIKAACYPIACRGGFMHVQHVRPNKERHKGKLHGPENVWQQRDILRHLKVHLMPGIYLASRPSPTGAGVKRDWNPCKIWIHPADTPHKRVSVVHSKL